MFAWKQWSFFVPSFQAMSRDWIYYFYFVVSRLVVKRNCEPTVARRGVYWFRNLATVSYGSQRISFLSAVEFYYLLMVGSTLVSSFMESVDCWWNLLATPKPRERHVARQTQHQLQDCVHKRNVTSQEISDTILDMVSSFDGVPVT